VIEGTVEVELDRDAERLGPDVAIRLSADQTRQLHNIDDGKVRLLLVSVPE